VYFRILGEITDVETIATGQVFVNWRGCGGAMAEAGGANGREQRRWSSLAA